MAEKLTLAAPIAYPATTTFTLESMFLGVKELRVVVNLLGENGERVSKEYDSTTTPTGAQVLHAINTGNFSTNSLVHALFSRLITDNVISGTVTGTVS